MTKLEARATELENQLEQSASQVFVAESKYLLLYDEAQTTGISCDGEMKQLLINTSRDVLRYMDGHHSKAVKSKNTFTESFRGSIASLVQLVHILFTKEIAKSVGDAGREGMIEIRESIIECEAAAKHRLGRLVGGDLASSRTGAAIPVARETGVTNGVASGFGPSNYCLL